MRYLYQEPIVTTVTDEDITDDKAIKELLSAICNNGSSVHMAMEDPQHPDYVKSFENVRITSVGENTIDIHAFFNGASIKYRDVPFVNVQSVRVVASKQVLSQKYKVTRWHYMDVAEISDD